MRSWIWKHPWAVRIDVVLFLICMVVFGYFWYASNNRANRIEATYPRIRTTRVYLGNNLSTTATAITGATVHEDYRAFIRHSVHAVETYLVREKDPQGYNQDAVYALMPNGHTYSSKLAIEPPNRDYTEKFRRIDDGDLEIQWRLDPVRMDIFGGLLLLLFTSFFIGLFTALATARSNNQ